VPCLRCHGRRGDNGEGWEMAGRRLGRTRRLPSPLCSVAGHFSDQLHARFARDCCPPLTRHNAARWPLLSAAASPGEAGPSTTAHATALLPRRAIGTDDHEKSSWMCLTPAHAPSRSTCRCVESAKMHSRQHQTTAKFGSVRQWGDAALTQHAYKRAAIPSGL
jgi:hypothetical protein